LRQADDAVAQRRRDAVDRAEARLEPVGRIGVAHQLGDERMTVRAQLDDIGDANVRTELQRRVDRGVRDDPARIRLVGVLRELPARIGLAEHLPRIERVESAAGEAA